MLRFGHKQYKNTWRSVLHLMQQGCFRNTCLGLSATFFILCGLAGFAIVLGSVIFVRSSASRVYEIIDTNPHFFENSPLGPQAALRPFSTVFTPEVLYWTPLINAWAIEYQIDPNLIATVIQIESCGDSQVASPAGAQGLFQVMPFHFDVGEDMLDVQTNAKRGLAYLVGSLNRADGHVGLALAGYNGGHGVIDQGWAAWSSETQHYYYWGARIYAEVTSGIFASPTLQEWFEVGGYILCAQAGETQRQLEEEKQAQS